MMKNLVFFLTLLTTFFSFSQVGINTTSPDAQLDIRSSNQVAPSNTDGLLIPKIDAFPATNPTLAQQGMLVYLTTQNELHSYRKTLQSLSYFFFRTLLKLLERREVLSDKRK